MGLLTPPVTHLFVLLVMMMVFTAVPAWIHGGPWAMGFWMFLVGSALLQIHVVSAFGSKRFDPALGRVMSKLPLFMLWKARVYVQALLFGSETRWIRTTRDWLPTDGTIAPSRGTDGPGSENHPGSVGSHPSST